MSFVAVAIGGSSLIGAGASIYGASKAADVQSKAAQNALDFQKQQFAASQDRLDAARTNFQPYLDTGKGATYTLGSLMGTNGQPADYSSFFKSPDYNFAQQQGELGIERGANARGLNLSGGTLKDLASFNSGLATQQYGNYFQRLMGLSQLGANAASGVGNLATGQATNATNAANSIGNTTMGVGQAQASGYVGGANAINSGISSGISNSLLANYLGKSPSAYAGPAYGGNNGVWGGSSRNPLSGFNPSDYGEGF